MHDHLGLPYRKADGRSDLFSLQTLGGVKVFWWSQTLFFEQKWEEDSGGQAEDGQEDRRISTYSCGICFPHISCQRQLTVDSYYIAVTLLCGTFLCILLSVVVMKLVRPTRPCSAPPDYLFTLGWLTNNVALILPPEADQRQSEISPLSASETLTQGRVQRIAAGSPHANCSVKKASVSKWREAFKAVYETINCGEKPLQITKACATRWLSIEPAMSRIWTSGRSLGCILQWPGPVNTDTWLRFYTPCTAEPKNILYLTFLSLCWVWPIKAFEGVQ